MRLGIITRCLGVKGWSQARTDLANVKDDAQLYQKTLQEITRCIQCNNIQDAVLEPV